ncbi:MAG: hypothetical protein BWY19_00847 [bacterium ADurb.Bin212]|nr:MAG: hypothetical protein BWY19_00847 [bacterium ADurb.Bin212]
MILRRRLFYGAMLLLAATVVIVFFAVIKFWNASASENQVRGKLVWQTSMLKDFDKDGTKEKLVLRSYQQDNRFSNYISLEKGLFYKREKELVGFEDDLVFCPQKSFENRSENIICVFGEVGVHSENIQFLDFDNFNYIKFIDEDGRRRDNITFDAPYFNFETDPDKGDVVYFDSRNYEADPLVDIIRSYYYLDNTVFKFLHKEFISTEGSIK